MPQRDIDHELVKNALIKDEWKITHDPLHLRFGGINFFIDLGAEGLIAADKANRKIAVEVKGFAGLSLLSEFHTAVGQYMNYRLLLAEEEPDRVLYLAVPEGIYTSFFETPFGQLAERHHQLKILVYDDEDEVIVRWIQ